MMVFIPGNLNVELHKNNNKLREEKMVEGHNT